VAYFKELSRHSLIGTDEATSIISQDNRYPGRDFNLEPPGYKSEANFTGRSVTIMEQYRWSLTLTNAMEQSPSREGDGREILEGVYCLPSNTQVHYRAHKSLLLPSK
jgi:hypothetical protein